MPYRIVGGGFIRQSYGLIHRTIDVYVKLQSCRTLSMDKFAYGGDSRRPERTTSQRVVAVPKFGADVEPLALGHGSR